MAIEAIRVPSAASPTLSFDLSARKLTPAQIQTVMIWVEHNQDRPSVPRPELEEHFRQAGFSPEEIKGVLVSLIKESVRPKTGKYLLLVLIIVLFFAIIVHWL